MEKRRTGKHRIDTMGGLIRSIIWTVNNGGSALEIRLWRLWGRCRFFPMPVPSASTSNLIVLLVPPPSSRPLPAPLPSLPSSTSSLTRNLESWGYPQLIPALRTFCDVTSHHLSMSRASCPLSDLISIICTYLSPTDRPRIWQRDGVKEIEEKAECGRECDVRKDMQKRNRRIQVIIIIISFNIYNLFFYSPNWIRAVIDFRIVMKILY